MDKRTHPIRIVIASDDPIFRDELRRLESEQDMKVVGEACDGFEAVKLATEIKPDILLLDLDMPHHTGLDALRDLNRAGGAGPVRIILLTVGSARRCAEVYHWPTVTQKHSCGDGRGVLGGAGQNLESGAVPARPHAECERGTKKLRADAARIADYLGGCRGL
jgi:CheY-like chemotaxis protein